MVMKDKLVKTNHKGSYYLMKKISIAFLVIASAAFIIALPTYIVQTNKTKNALLKAEEESSSILESENSEEVTDYEEFSN